MPGISPRNGFFVRYGYPEKPVGAGIGFGGGYRHDLFDRRARVVAEAGWTLRQYSLLRGDFSLPYLAHERAEVGVEVTRRYNPQEDFYGTGPDSVEADRTNYRLDTTAAIARALIKPRRWFTAGGHAGWSSPSVGSGKDARSPSSEVRFGADALVGFSEQPDFRYTDLFVAVDYRDRPEQRPLGRLLFRDARVVRRPRFRSLQFPPRSTCTPSSSSPSSTRSGCSRFRAA